MNEVSIRRSRGAALVTLGVGLAGLAAWLLVDFLRTPYLAVLLLVAVAVGLAALVDRRVQLSISEAGVRYVGWGREVIPWQEFSGYRWTDWRGQPYLQLLPRRPSELVAGFSPVGRLNHALSALLRMPAFAIGTNRLEVGEAELSELAGRHLPAA